MNLDSLYQDIILDHYKHPRNFKKLDYISEDNIHENPSCGDSLKLDLKIENGIIKEVLHESKGCAISVSSASMMTEFLTGKTIDEAKEIIQHFIDIMQGKKPVEDLENYDDLTILKGVISYPLRVKCATLSWHALLSMVSGSH